MIRSLRILYVASEIAPFLSSSNVGAFVGKLAPAIHEENIDIRILVPRFGIINERKNKLHEVVRLSGLNIKIGNDTQNLSVKVTAIPGTRIQVYFIDNETYFHRKFLFKDKEDNFFEDNYERLIFICKGVLGTVRNLNWVPDIVHCHDWITSLIPMYIKTSLKQDPIFQKTKVIFNLYDTFFPEKFNNDFAEKARMPGMQEEDLALLNSVGFEELLQIGCAYADAVIKSEVLSNPNLDDIFTKKGVRYINNDEEGIKDYHDIYKKIAML